MLLSGILYRLYKSALCETHVSCVLVLVLKVFGMYSLLKFVDTLNI